MPEGDPGNKGDSFPIEKFQVVLMQWRKTKVRLSVGWGRDILRLVRETFSEAGEFVDT